MTIDEIVDQVHEFEEYMTKEGHPPASEMEYYILLAFLTWRSIEDAKKNVSKYWQQSDEMPSHQLNASMIVIKNLLLTETITREQACMAMWDLSIEASGIDPNDIHYVVGDSETIDKLLKQLKG